MGSVREEIEIVGTFKEKRVMALFDSGAQLNYIRKKLTDGDNIIEDIGLCVYEGKHIAIMADESRIAAERIRFKEIRIRSHKEQKPIFVIMDKLAEDAIIGVYLMQKLGISLDIPNESIKFE